jgi:hypothetical protein
MVHDTVERGDLGTMTAMGGLIIRAPGGRPWRSSPQGS